jgi:hypothetical protein
MTRRAATPGRSQLACVLAGLFIAGSQLSCEEIPSSQILQCADLETFPAVSNVLEKRCGTLDCHGSLARPLRLYGKGGLRLATQDELNSFEVAQDAGTFAGGKGTTEDEVEANWRSACALEPELTAKVVQAEAEPIELILLSKPLGQEEDGGQRHKGGAVFIKGGVGFDCVRSWLEGAVDTAACTEATNDL